MPSLYAEIQADSPSYHWPLTELAGTTAYNYGSIGGAGDMTYNGVTPNQGRGPACAYSPNISASFPGTSSSTISIVGNGLQTSNLLSFTVEAYVYIPSSLAGTSDPMTIVAHRSQLSTIVQWFIATYNLTATGAASTLGYRMFRRVTAPFGATSAPVVDVCYDRWNQVVMVWESTAGTTGQVMIYWNGLLVQGPVAGVVNDWTLAPPNQWRFDIGHDGYNNYYPNPPFSTDPYPFIGRQAQVAFYNGQALSAARVLDHWNAMCGGCGSAKGVSILEFV